MSYLKAIHTAVPAHEIDADAFAHFVEQQVGADAVTLRKLRWLGSRTGIQQRYAVLSDYNSAENARLYFRAGAPQHGSVQERMQLYRELALELSLQAIRPVLVDQVPPTHIVYTSCTGLSAPGIEVALIRALGLSADTFRHTVNFMGCYAALHALRTAHYICEAEPNARVLVVCTELCSLHFQHATHDDALLSNLLFGDGSAALMLCGSAGKEGTLLAFDDFYAALLPGGEAEMSWDLSPTGFEMRLSSYVPALLSEHLDAALAGAWRRWGISAAEVHQWVLHPGGKSILDKLQQALALPVGEPAASYATLRDYGNMSSATILFVLDRLLRAPATTEECLVLAAFGPGLSMELASARRLSTQAPAHG